MFIVFLIFLPISLFSWDLQKEAIFKSTNNPNFVVIQVDGEVLDFSTNYNFGELSKKEVLNWKSGRKGSFVFDSKEGSFFLDSETGKALFLFGNLKSHPIDTVSNACVNRDGSTSGIVDCGRETLKLWDSYLNTVSQKLSSRLPERQQKLLDVSQKAWIDFRDKKIKYLQNYYNRSGTIWQIILLENIVEVTKKRTIELESFLGF
ncbi:hypothetical protein ThvES_00016720 [Thiovulum sp. ES]|nr:hypothetical protein ThvES_00016720 [Thiovulum sp. ES]